MNQTKEWLKFRKSQFADTSHIRACRETWFNHQANCKACQVFDFTQCPTLGAEFHEVCAAITANPNCETLEAKCVKTTTP